MGAMDVVLAVLIVGAALAILYRTVVRSGGKCAGCSGGCAPKRGDAERPGLVRLGAPRGGGCKPGEMHRV